MTRSKIVAIFALATILSACVAGSQGFLRLLEADGALRIEPDPAPTHDYLVYLRNVIDFGYDADRPEDRNSIALQAMAAQCPTATIAGESVIETGTYLGGRPSRTYVIEIRC